MVRLPVLVFFAALAAAAPAAVSTFDTDHEGWQTCDLNFVQFAPPVASDFAAAAWSASAGNPGGAILTPDVSNWCFLAAPAKFLGDQSAAFGSDFTFDTLTTQNDGLPYPAVVLTSGTTTLYAVTPPPGTTWAAVSIPLVGSSWSLSPAIAGTDPFSPVSDDVLRSVLSNLSGLYIEADWLGMTPSELTGLDNVRLNPVPEPASLAALALGALAYVRRTRRA